MRLRFVVAGKTFETYSSAKQRLGELVKNVLMAAGHGDHEEWECRNLEGDLFDLAGTVGDYFEEGELGEMRGTVFVNARAKLTCCAGR